MHCLITTIAELKWIHKPLILTPRCNFTELWNISTLKRGNGSEKLYKRFSSFAKNIVRIMKGGGGYSSICNLFSEFWGHSLHDQIRKVVFDSSPTNWLAIFKPLVLFDMFKKTRLPAKMIFETNWVAMLVKREGPHWRWMAKCSLWSNLSKTSWGL